ncbi:MAG: sugar-binding domain-containing protein [Jiangellales bacterium]
MTQDSSRALLTPWGEALDRDCPLPEYPRPQLQRDSFVCLNGPWEYAITSSLNQPAAYAGTILVPFSPESALSGVGHVLQPDEVLHYRRSFRLPAGLVAHWDDRVLLHFGAVDQWCRVEVNGHVVGEHTSGYLPFTLDVTSALVKGLNDLRVVVRDPSDTGLGSRGKQRLARGGIWYTPQSGIWQTVWLESVPALYIDRLAVVPDLEAGAVDVSVHVVDRRRRTTRDDQTCTVTVRADGARVASGRGPSGQPIRVVVPHPREWSPEDPYLYDLEISVGRDRVRSYAGLRSFALGRDADGTPRLMLNGRPYFHAGVLDQGYWSDGLYTAPSDEALKHDVATVKRLGFTMIRKHIKIEPLRWYYHCDRLGILVWQDMVNGGGQYRAPVVTAPALGPINLSDSRYELFARSDASGRRDWLHEMRDTVEHLRSVVSLAMWVPFNEGWGQFDAAWVAGQVRRLDPTRTVDHASGWHDQGAGDLTSKHVYFRPFRLPRRRARTGHRAIALTEYGGYSLHVAEHSASAEAFGYRRYSSADDLAAAFTSLHTEQVVPAIARGLAATVYTQLSDVEDETNGLLTYDRRVQKMSDEVVQAVTRRLRL